MPPPLQQDSRLPVLLLIIFILWVFPDPAPVPLGGAGGINTRDLIIENEARQLNVTNTTAYGAFDASKEDGSGWLNITGLRKEDGFVWDMLPQVKERAREQLKHAYMYEWTGQRLHDGRPLEPGKEGGEDSRGFSVWRNMSGHVRGQWVRADLDKELRTRRPTPNVTAILPWDARDFRRQWERNVTGEGGNLKIDFTEKGEGFEVDGVRLQNMKVEMVIQDDASSGDGWTLNMYGTHIVHMGSIIATTTSDKFAGMWALPQLALDDIRYRWLKNTTVDRLQTVIKKQKSLEMTSLNPYTSMTEGRSEDPYTPRCELVAYIQQHPLISLLSDGTLFTPTIPMIADMEEEMRYPEGARPYTPPPLRVSALIFSPDCGFVIESRGEPDYPPMTGSENTNHLVGSKWEPYVATSISWTLLYAIVLMLQIHLTSTQMKASSTPSTRSRISFYTIGIMSMGDGFIGMAFLPLGMLVEGAWLSLMSVAFFAFLGVTFFDMRWLLDVWGVQVAEQRRGERQAAESAPPATEPQATTPAPVITAAGADTLPLPVTAARQNAMAGASPFILPLAQNQPDNANAAQEPQTEAQRTRRDLGALYGKFYLLLLTLTFLSLHATSWPPALRTGYTNLLAFLYLSLWTPQIYRNIMRNCRKALLYRFVVGHSVLRLAPIGYFYLYSENALWVRTSPRAFLVLAGWVWVQVWVLVVQDVFGPRVGVPKEWVPRAYDYHPVLREDEEEAKMPIGFAPSSPTTERRGSLVGSSSEGATNPAESKDKPPHGHSNRRIYDCAICMQNIEVPILPAEGSGSQETSTEMMHNMVARRLYMLTPCRHIFHTKCLEAAMRYRLSCPVCREGLPPL